MKHKIYYMAVIFASLSAILTIYLCYGNKHLPVQEQIKIQQRGENHEIYEEIDKEILLLEHSSEAQHN